MAWDCNNQSVLFNIAKALRLSRETSIQPDRIIEAMVRSSNAIDDPERYINALRLADIGPIRHTQLRVGGANPAGKLPSERSVKKLAKALEEAKCGYYRSRGLTVREAWRCYDRLCRTKKWPAAILVGQKHFGVEREIELRSKLWGHSFENGFQRRLQWHRPLAALEESRETGELPIETIGAHWEYQGAPLQGKLPV